ncbi:MAG: 1-deoxy-D-xylulose-5-phosphate reductoisomerase [Lachnospiraceae bacterium]|nr:1-deoxy-D-xylulose-5-phosphate reductoisomerase [Lachnospiraceae bacterium]
MKKIGILGSTGSIGTQTLEIIRHHRDEIQVTALAAGGNVDLLEKQVREFAPQVAALWSEKACRELRERIRDLDVRVVCGMDGLLEIAALDGMEALVTAVVGMIGVRPTLEAISHGKDILLANKETLVTAGHLLMPMAREQGVSILPVDSEHSAIFQSLNGEKKSRIKKILLTASGGPFRGKKRKELEGMRAEDALRHPNWSMGRKITIDSATLVNKGLEVMEAVWLFGVELSQIQVVVQPQSIIHSMVEYVDGSVIAQLGLPDMKLPIQYALFYPDRRPMAGPSLDFYELAGITFEKPDMETFRGLALAFDAMKAGGSMPVVYNAANEQAVSLFLDHRISFLEIAEIIEDCMGRHQVVAHPDVEQILEAERWTNEVISRRHAR